MNLMNSFIEEIKNRGKHVAIVDQSGRSISYEDLHEMIISAMINLQAAKVKKGSRVLVLVPLSIEIYAVIAALFAVGATVVFIDPWASKDYITKALNKVEPTDVIYSTKASLFFLINRSIRSVPNRMWLKKIIKSPTQKSSVKVQDVYGDDSALITFTTGSSGNPKGFDRTHDFLMAQQLAHETYFNHTKSDVDLCMFPVFVLSNLASGLTSVLVNADIRKIGEADSRKLIEQINREKITSITCSPAMLLPLVTQYEKAPFELKTIEKLYTGGAPVNPLLFRKLKLIFPNAKLYLVYGSTEAEPIAILESTELLKITEEKTLNGEGIALGRLVDQLTAIINNVDSNILDPVPYGEIGELVLTGPFVGKKYYKDQEAFKENKIVDHKSTVWHRTGDLVYLYDDILFMVGRKHNRYLVDGIFYYPLLVEPLVDQHKGVKRSALVASKESLHIFIEEIARGLVDLLKIEAEMHERKIPIKSFRFVEKIPLDPRHNAKIDYNELKKRYGVEK